MTPEEIRDLLAQCIAGYETEDPTWGRIHDRIKRGYLARADVVLAELAKKNLAIGPEVQAE